MQARTARRVLALLVLVVLIAGCGPGGDAPSALASLSATTSPAAEDRSPSPGPSGRGPSDGPTAPNRSSGDRVARDGDATPSTGDAAPDDQADERRRTSSGGGDQSNDARGDGTRVTRTLARATVARACVGCSADWRPCGTGLDLSTA